MFATLVRPALAIPSPNAIFNRLETLAIVRAPPNFRFVTLRDPPPEQITPPGQFQKDSPRNEKKEEDPNLFTGVHSIALGTEHGLALTTDQRVFVWGRNNYGQCGYRTTLKLKVYQDLYAPKEIIYLKGTVQIAAGSKSILEAPLYVYF